LGGTVDADELAIEARKHRLEVWKLLIAILTPLVLAYLTYVINNAIQERGAILKREEQILSEKQKIYAELGKRLNVFYIYVSDLGDFRSYQPPRVVEMKREADRQFFMYRPYWSSETESRYNEFMKSAFQTYNGAGLPAKVRGRRDQKLAAYEVDKLVWQPEWDSYFTEEVDSEITVKYYALVSSILADTVSSTIRKLPR